LDHIDRFNHAPLSCLFQVSTCISNLICRDRFVFIDLNKCGTVPIADISWIVAHLCLYILSIIIFEPVYRTECKHCVISDTIFYTHLFVTTFRRNLHFENIFSVVDLRTLFVPVLSSNISSIVPYWVLLTVNCQSSIHTPPNILRSAMELVIKLTRWLALIT
jgi:hypothetical protein